MPRKSSRSLPLLGDGDLGLGFNIFSVHGPEAPSDRTDEEQEATIARQQKQIEALSVGLQKVRAQLAAASPSGGGLEASKPAPQIVLNNQ